MLSLSFMSFTMFLYIAVSKGFDFETNNPELFDFVDFSCKFLESLPRLQRTWFLLFFKEYNSFFLEK